MSEFPIDKPVKEKKAKKEKSYINFTETTKKDKKTKTWIVRNIQNNVPIGEVKWFGSWRQYCFYPYKETVYNADCLGQILVFLNKENLAWREAKKLKKASKV